MPAQHPKAASVPSERGAAPPARNWKPISRQQMAAFDTEDWSASYLVLIQRAIQQTVPAAPGSRPVIGPHLARFLAPFLPLAHPRTRAPQDVRLCGSVCRGPRDAQPHPPARPNGGQFGRAEQTRRLGLSSPCDCCFPGRCRFCGRRSFGKEALSCSVRQLDTEQGSAMSARD